MMGREIRRMVYDQPRDARHAMNGAAAIHLILLGVLVSLFLFGPFMPVPVLGAVVGTGAICAGILLARHLFQKKDPPIR